MSKSPSLFQFRLRSLTHPRQCAVNLSAGLRFVVLVLVMVAGIVSTSTQAAKQAAARAAWTLMFYEDADNSLETPQLANIKEMLQLGSSDSVQMVMLCDRSPKSEPKDQYTDEAIGGLPNWSGAKLLHVEKGKLKPLADWGDTNMADPTTLRRFLDASAKAYPADHYGLIIADHGTGWEALCVDESSGDKVMSLRDLRAGLEPFAAAHGKLEIVGLDACLMASFETAQALAPVAHMMVASEELAPARGWNYDAVSKAVVEKPTMTGYDLGRAIVDAYTIHFREAKDPLEKSAALGTTLSLLDLDQFPLLVSAMSAMGDRCIASLQNGRSGWIKVARSRAASEEYGATGVRGEGGEEEMHDLMGIAQSLEASGDPAIAEAAKQVDDAIRKVVRYFMRGPCRSHAGGISAYFPIDGISLQDATGSAYLSRTFARDCRWINFLSLYSVAVRDFAERPKLKPLKATGKTAARDKPVEIFSKATDEDIDKVYFLMLAHDGPDMLVIGRLPTFPTPDGTLAQRFRGEWFMLTDKKRAVTCPITAFEALDSKGASYLAYVPAQIRRAGSAKWIDVEFTFLIDILGGAPHGQLLYAFAGTSQGPLQIPLHPGDSIRPVYTRIKADGDVTDWTAGENGAIHLDDPGDFSVGWGLVGKGAYLLGFEVVNLAGMPSMELDDFLLE
jgi:hypothetical protein